MQDQYRAIVIDPGSWLTKAGFAGEGAPRSVFPTAVGLPCAHHHEKEMAGTREEHQTGGFYVGHEAMARRCTDGLKLSYPVTVGTVADMESMEKIMHHIIHDDLRVVPDEHPFLIPVWNDRTPRILRQRMAQLMFETIGVPALYLPDKPQLALYAFGSTTGVVLRSGDDLTSAVPIYEGYALYTGILTLHVAGRTLSDHLGSMLIERHPCTSSLGLRAFQRIKEDRCYVAQDPQHEAHARAGPEEAYQLPDGHTITLGDERWRVPEALFQPALVGMTDPGIHELTRDAIRRCDADPDFLRDMYGNVVLAGGTTMFPGLPDRLQKELAALAPAGVKVKVIAPPERRYAAWIGGSILASLASFSRMWVSREEYDESGPSVMTSQSIYTDIGAIFREKKSRNNNRA